MSWYGRYRPVGDVRARAEKRIAKLRAQGHEVHPVAVKGRQIAKTFWGRAWCENLERYSDYANRLPRGRTYVRRGAILDLQVAPGRIVALVVGTRLYDVEIGIDTLPEPRWEAIRSSCAGRIESLVALLRGELSDAVMEVVTQPRSGLFPSPPEIHLGCSCPDWAVMCKHVAAVLYGVGNRLDEAPELLFALRGADPEALIATAIDRGIQRKEAGGRVLEVDDLSAVFGVDIDFSEEALSPGRAAPATEPAELSERARRVLAVIRAEPGLRTPQIAARLGVSRSTVQNGIRELRGRGRVEFVGAPRSGGYHPA